jgi:hypothetical protein
MQPLKNPAPGQPWGPCENEKCGHARCQRIRLRAALHCCLCSKPIGYDIGYYSDGETICHAACYAEEEARAAAKVTEVEA